MNFLRLATIKKSSVALLAGVYARTCKARNGSRLLITSISSSATDELCSRHFLIRSRDFFVFGIFAYLRDFCRVD